MTDAEWPEVYPIVFFDSLTNPINDGIWDHWRGYRGARAVYKRIVIWKSSFAIYLRVDSRDNLAYLVEGFAPYLT